MPLTLSTLATPFFRLLSLLHLAPPVPAPFPNRLAPLDPSSSTIDNDIYNTPAFDWSRSGLDLLNPARVGYFMDKLHRYVSAFESTEVVIVDLGCGAGIALEAIHSALELQGAKRSERGLSDGKRSYRLVGVDVSQRSIEAARSRAEKKAMSIEYLVADIYSLPFPAASVDAIICSDVLEHLFDPASAFSSISRCLKPSGILTFDTINRTPVSFYLTIWILQDLLHAMQGDAHDHRLYVTPAEVQQVMRENGLKPGPERDLVGMRPGFNWPHVALYGLFTGKGFIMSVLAEFRVQSGDLGVSYLHWCEKV